MIDPLIWRQSLSDDWQLTWTPLPLMATHQLRYDETGYAGIAFGMGGGYSSFGGVILAPVVGAMSRRKLNPTVAFDTQMSWQPVIQLGGGAFEWTGNVSAQALFQVSPHIALTVGPGLTFSNAQVIQSTYYTTPTSDNTHFQVALPISSGFRWSFHRQWDLDLNYRISFLGLSSSQQGGFQFVHFW